MISHGHEEYYRLLVTDPVMDVIFLDGSRQASPRRGTVSDLDAFSSAQATPRNWPLLNSSAAAA